jgi:hypothetical protein
MTAGPSRTEEIDSEVGINDSGKIRTKNRCQHSEVKPMLSLPLSRDNGTRSWNLSK